MFIFSETYSQSDILGLRWQFCVVMCQDCTSPLKLTYISCLLGFILKCCETRVEIYKGRKDADPSFPLRRNDKQFHWINMLRGRMFGLLTQSVLCPETVVGRFVLTQKMSIACLSASVSLCGLSLQPMSFTPTGQNAMWQRFG